MIIIWGVLSSIAAAYGQAPALSRTLDPARVQPLIETQYHFTQPLIRLVESGEIPAPTFDITAAHRLDTEVFILAGRADEAVDYRASIALAAHYPHHYLFIANDNHTFEKLNKSGDSNRIVRAFLESG